ncbi:HGL097Cp [Eremothecium sinecaudum]|uniref:HGL097Cp n=1 Tax=Eremothecium sinecaudum TaxID=45286 RepID=A0A109V0A2_9SACH|nr:HGL097Cp [Eremothecium sinecaudum]AMD22243.1 HGL097Cp [Eremothecium sinecaudum]
MSIQASPLVRKLASNSRKTREDALASLRSFITTKQFRTQSQLQFDQLWKGLYYAMWFSDRPRPQQRLACQLGELHLLFLEGSTDVAVRDKAFIRFSLAFWKVLCLEWYNIDHHRLDKYLLLVRLVFYHQLKYLRERQWDEELVTKYITAVLQKLPLSGDTKVYNGIPLHIIDIFADEWERVAVTDESEEDEHNFSVEEQRELIQKTPIAQFIAIFERLASNTDNSKVIRNKIKEDFLQDQRFRDWDVISEEQEEESDPEEWHGF